MDGSNLVHFGARPVTYHHTLQTTLQSALAQSTKLGSSGFVGDPMENYGDPNMGVRLDDQ